MPNIENEYAKFWIDRNILFFVYKPNTIIDLKAAKIIVADRLKFQNERSFPVFCDIRGIKDVDKTARDYLAREGSTLTRAVSILVAPPVSHVILEFYLKVSKPNIPSKIFTDRQKALRFLETFISP
ncbi:hypothetical protein IBL28_07915 [Sinomicrobium sp. FJxs]|uniref:DUF7793 domain-containing protein n=2 Tax=Sinomicrobium weinanense TaxID=2842200 RepID=A0A926JQZ7_9FLAO|nr:hypothetical protein [Sinomicrobium weinanense]MBU3124734.1 hypothetical protein [Sinomicrobium weinanense]